jgi:hypothetical protein
MPIDPSIPLQVQPIKLESPMNQLAMMNEALKYGEMTRGIDTQNKLRELYSQGVDVSTPEGFKQLASVDPASAMKLKTQALEGRKLGAETGLKEFELKNNKINTAITRLANLHSPQEAAASIAEQVQSGDLPPERAQQLMQQLQTTPFNQFKSNQLTSILSAKDNLTMAEQAKHNRVTEGIAGGHLQIARENQQGVAQTLTDAAGNVTLLNRQGDVIKRLDAAGKPSATFEKTAALQKQQGKDLGLAITELERVTKDGGLIDQSTGSGAGRAADVAAGFIGKATPGAIAIAKLKPIADMALKMVPRFEGPQSDKDTASYKEAAGQLADASLPNEIRKEAGREVLRLMKARKGQFVSDVMATEGMSAGGPALPPGFKPD